MRRLQRVLKQKDGNYTSPMEYRNEDEGSRDGRRDVAHAEIGRKILQETTDGEKKKIYIHLPLAGKAHQKDINRVCRVAIR